MKRNKNRIAAVLLTVLMSLSFLLNAYAEETIKDKTDDAWTWIKNLTGEAKLVCDVEKDPAYRNFGIAGICNDLNTAYDAKVLNYRNQYITVLGVVTDISSNYSKITLTDIEGKGGQLTAKSSNDKTKQAISSLKKGDTVRVYGKCQVGTRFDKSVTIKIDRIEKSTQTANKKDTVYSFLSGASYDTQEGEKRTIAGKMSYVMPKAWKDVEEEITGAGMKGFLYRVNEIPAGYKTEPEQVYVFWFDYETGLKYLSDRDERVKEIERAVVSNILVYDTASSFPDRNITLENGRKLTYYDTSYQGNDKKIHNVEFVFSPESDGLFCIMYVFKSSDHKEDIIYLLQTLEAK